jgi:tricorn protease
VEKNRKYVDEKSGGQIGYLHIPDMGASGLIEFAKAWYPQTQKKGFIIDERYNGGGFTADMIINRLAREMWGVTKPREGKLLRVPERVFHGSWVVLINEDTGSDGEFFAEAIKILKLAPIIGMRTWGGATGIEAHQDLVDGGSVTPPQFGLYGLDRRWLIEGIGVVPDIQVQNMPGDVLHGKDAQLDAALEKVQKMMKENPREIPPTPAFPNKSRQAGMEAEAAQAKAVDNPAPAAGAKKAP